MVYLVAFGNITWKLREQNFIITTGQCVFNYHDDFFLSVAFLSYFIGGITMGSDGKAVSAGMNASE